MDSHSNENEIKHKNKHQSQPERRAAISVLPEKSYLGKIDKKKKELYCSVHIYNILHIFCEECEKLICDKCEIEDHSTHKRQSFLLTKNYTYLANIIKIYTERLKIRAHNGLANFDEKLDQRELIIDDYFDGEYSIIADQINLMVRLLTENLQKIKLLYSKLKEQFRENIVQIKNKHMIFKKDLENFTKTISDYLDKNQLTPNENFVEVQNYLTSKSKLEKGYQALKSYYDLNKKKLANEFSYDEYKNYLDRNYEFLTRFFKDNDSKFSDNKVNLLFRIDNITINTSKTVILDNIIPINSQCMYQTIERSNILTEYNIDQSKFKKILVRPEIEGYEFSFLKFSRSMNFAGRVIVTGGVKVNINSKDCWIIEDKNNFTVEGKLEEDEDSNSITSIPTEDQFFDSKNPTLVYYKAKDMIHSHAAHSITNYYPYIAIVLGGIDNNDKCEMYDIRTNIWQELPNLTHHRIDPTTLIYREYLYVFFGIIFSNSTKTATYTDKIERILLSASPTEMVWELIETNGEEKDLITLPRSLCGTTFCNENTIYLLGGQVKKDTYSDDIFKFNFDTLHLKKENEKKLFKKTVFIENRFCYGNKKTLNFDFNGDMFMYFPNHDNFGFQFQNFN